MQVSVGRFYGNAMSLSTVAAERDFSKLKIVKTYRRNLLNPDSLNRLLLISMVGPPLERFDFVSCARAFMVSSVRTGSVDSPLCL